MKTLTIRRPDDFHIHFRRGEILRKVISFTAKHWARAMAMPNTEPPILTGRDALQYRREILLGARRIKCRRFKPLMTIKILPSTTPKMIIEAKKMGVVAGKIYPEGVTTNSKDGVSNFKALTPVFEAMQKVGMVLSLHGESPGVFVLDRERHFLQTLEWLSKTFPRLKIVLEHITTADAVDAVRRLPKNVVATITIQHLLCTLHDLLCFQTKNGEFLNPHLYCKPVLKFDRDREALIGAALSGNPKFFYGGDSAPHARTKKEAACACAGVFNAPVALALLAELFDRFDLLEMLENFVSRFGAKFYGLPLNPGTITLQKKTWRVPEEYDGIVPFMAGKEISWSIRD